MTFSETQWFPRIVAAGLLLIISAVVSVQAEESFDGEIGLLMWTNQAETESDDLLDNGTLNGFAEAWWSRNWGVRGSLYRSELTGAGIDNSDHYSVDLKRRFYSLSNNSFVALGAGWEEIELGSGLGSSSGPRLIAEGRFGLGGAMSFYGQTSWMPDLDDTAAHSNLEGRGFEAGLSFEPAPSMSLRLGYRRFRLDFDHGNGSDSAESDGFILGAGFHW